MLKNAYYFGTQRNFAQELVGILVGVAYRRAAQVVAPINTDCESALKALAGPQGKLRPFSQLLHFIRQLSRGQRMEFVPAHTLTCPQAEESPLYGNHLADLAASGTLASAHRLGPEILMDIADATGLWYVLDRQEMAPATLPPSGGYFSQIADYFSLRSERHQRSPTLGQVQLALGAQGTMSESQRGAVLKLVLNRFEDDRQLEDGSLRINCPCGCISHMTSWVATCQCPAIRTVREEGFQRLRLLLRRRPRLSWLVLGKLKSSPTSYDLWRGRWSRDDLRSFSSCVEAAYPDLLANNRQGERQLLSRIIRLTTQSALSLHTAGRKLRAPSEAGGTTSSYQAGRKRKRSQRGSSLPVDQPPITSFFPPADSRSTKKLRGSPALSFSQSQVRRTTSTVNFHVLLDST